MRTLVKQYTPYKILKFCKTLQKLGFSRIRKIIILGIPVSYEPDEVIQKFTQELRTEEHSDDKKVIRKENNKIFQIVIELEDSQAIQMVRKGRLLCGFNSCKIAPYISTIGCGNFQMYGHNASCCSRKTVCAHCIEGHILVPVPLLTSHAYIYA